MDARYRRHRTRPRWARGRPETAAAGYDAPWQSARRLGPEPMSVRSSLHLVLMRPTKLAPAEKSCQTCCRDGKHEPLQGVRLVHAHAKIGPRPVAQQGIV